LDTLKIDLTYVEVSLITKGLIRAVEAYEEERTPEFSEPTKELIDKLTNIILSETDSE